MSPTVIIIAKSGCKLCSALREKMQLLNVPCFYISYKASIAALPEEIFYYGPANDFVPVPFTWRKAPVTDALSVIMTSPDVDHENLPTPAGIFEGKVYNYAGTVKAVREYLSASSNRAS